MAIEIRKVTLEDVPFLREALYHAIFVPPEAEPPPRSLIDLPELAAYVEDFGTRAGDVGVLALDGATPVGAAWARLMRGYGFVNEATPELSISLLPGYRGSGIGTQMMKALLAALVPVASRVSLSVQVSNPAFRLYQRLGFQIVARDGESAIMVLSL
ncbi:MAG: N-acetyltransferase [Chloroflexota bacterium]|nr:N-acetyltransferase [Chloroflexota bacterium]